MISDPYAAQSRRQRTGLIVGAVLAVLVLVLGSRQLGLSQGTQAPDFGGGLQARSAAPPPITAESSAPPPPLLTEAAEPPPEAARMPADIREWLEHLERIERQRQALATQQVSSAMVSLTMLQGAGATQQILDGLLDTGEEEPTSKEPANPAAALQKDNQDYQAEWEKLMADFRALPPPPACVPLRNSYDQTLGQTEMMIDEIVGAMDKAGSDPQAALRDLFGMRGTSGGRIDAAAAQSNRNLDEVCRPYGVRPWFQIQTDSQAGILGKMGGLPDISGLGGGLGGGL